MNDLTHIDDRGKARMVDVGDKPTTARTATAEGFVTASPQAFAALRDGAGKGDVLAAARIAGIMAAKRVPDLIPLCHAVALSKAEVVVEPEPERGRFLLRASVRATDRTGVEMEALTAVTVAALTLYDMLKAVDRGMSIENVHLVEKHGGASGSYLRPMQVVPKSPPPAPAAPEPAEAEAPPPPLLDAAARSVEMLFNPAARGGRRRPSTAARHLAARVEPLDAADADLLARLSRDPVGCAYMLGDLDMPYAEQARWFGLRGEQGTLDGVLLVYEGLSVPAVLTSGGGDEVEALLLATHGDLPRQFYAHIRTHHRDAMEPFYDVSGAKEMIRMGLDRARYRPCSDPGGVFPLSHPDTGAIMQLYMHYPDNFFEPAQLDTGLYFGVREGDELASVAGIHVFSERHDIAAIGNIVTHSDHRGRGLASKCVRRLLDALFEKVDHVALNVEVGNEAAIACYRKFGFREHYRFFEGTATAL